MLAERLGYERTNTGAKLILHETGHTIHPFHFAMTMAQEVRCQSAGGQRATEITKEDEFQHLSFPLGGPMVKQLDSGPNRALFEFKVYGFRHSVVLS